MDTSRYESEVRWIPVAAAATYLRVTRQRVYQLLSAGALVSIRVQGTVLVSYRSVEARIALLTSERRSIDGCR